MQTMFYAYGAYLPSRDCDKRSKEKEREREREREMHVQDIRRVN